MASIGLVAVVRSASSQALAQNSDQRAEGSLFDRLNLGLIQNVNVYLDRQLRSHPEFGSQLQMRLDLIAQIEQFIDQSEAPWGGEIRWRWAEMDPRLKNFIATDGRIRWVQYQKLLMSDCCQGVFELLSASKRNWPLRFSLVEEAGRAPLLEIDLTQSVRARLCLAGRQIAWIVEEDQTDSNGLLGRGQLQIQLSGKVAFRSADGQMIWSKNDMGSLRNVLNASAYLAS